MDPFTPINSTAPIPPMIFSLPPPLSLYYMLSDFFPNKISTFSSSNLYQPFDTFSCINKTRPYFFLFFSVLAFSGQPNKTAHFSCIFSLIKQVQNVDVDLCIQVRSKTKCPDIFVNIGF